MQAHPDPNNELRQDPVTGRWVILSTGRAHRPQQFRPPQQEVGSRATAARDCPFCAHQQDTPPIVCRYGSAEPTVPWQVCVVPNLYPVMQPDTGPTQEARFDSGIHTRLTATGRHEVVIESPTHQEQTGALTSTQFTYMLHAYRDRMLAMKAMPGVQFVLPMKNSGRAAGASLRHTHSQLFGLPMVPDVVQLELSRATDFFNARQECIFCHLVHTEIEFADRIVSMDDHFVAWCPFASRFAYEVWVAPRRHRARFESTSDGDLQALGQFTQELIRKLDQNPQIQAYNYFLHSLPFDSHPEDHYHWHIEILPRIAMQAGFEWGTGIHINTVAPSRAASELRQGSV